MAHTMFFLLVSLIGGALANTTEHLYVHAQLRVKIRGDEHLFFLDGSQSSGNIDTYTWTLEQGDDRNFMSNEVETHYYPKLGGFYKFRLTICSESGLCVHADVTTTIKTFTKCQREYQEVLSHTSTLADPQIADWTPPNCTPDGDYERVQCVFNYPPCHCVHPKSGAIRFGDFRFMSPSDYDCKRAPRACELVIIQSQIPGASVSDDGWLPKCRKNGWYEPKQCNPEAPRGGQCWCSTKAGEEKAGTRTLSTERLTCKRAPTACEIQRNAILVNDEEPFYVPQCTRKGNYKKKQKRVNQNMVVEYFCVDKLTGDEIPNSVGDSSIRC